MKYLIVKNLDDHPFYFGQELKQIGYSSTNELLILQDDNGNKYAASEDELQIVD